LSPFEECIHRILRKKIKNCFKKIFAFENKPRNTRKRALNTKLITLLKIISSFSFYFLPIFLIKKEAAGDCWNVGFGIWNLPRGGDRCS
jgi:hypothetical protein